MVYLVDDYNRAGQPHVLSSKPSQGVKERLLFGRAKVVLSYTLNHRVCERVLGKGNNGSSLTWSRISMHNAASAGPKAKINLLPSFDDKISAMVLTAAFSSFAVRAFFHSLRKLVSMTMVGGSDGGRIKDYR